MKRLLCLAPAAAWLLVSCASVETAVVDTAGSSTRYCWKDRLMDDGRGLTCNWVASRADACEATMRSTLPRSAVSTGPEAAGRCNNGQWLMRVTTK